MRRRIDWDFWKRLSAYLWLCTRGYHLTPWRSPYLKWRLQTAFGGHVDDMGFWSFWKTIIVNRKQFWRFLKWAVEMQRATERNKLRRK